MKNVTKTQMAQRITKQLYMLNTLPAPTHHHVVKLARKKKFELENLVELADRAEIAAVPADEPRTGPWVLVRDFINGQLTSEHETEIAASTQRDEEILSGKTFRGGCIPTHHRIYQQVA
jgi:hypothetical protein